MNKILLTGVAGFIASRTAELFLQEGNEVVGIDNMNNYYDIRLKEHRLANLSSYSNFHFTRLDIEDRIALTGLFERHRFDAVINLAARAGVRASIENPYIYLSTNIQGTLNLLELMKVYQVKKMVLASTSSLYAGQSMPFSETLAVNTPISPYAATKKAAELMAYSYHYLFNLDITIVRYFTVYGPAGRPDMSIFRFIKWIDEGKPLRLYGDGNQSRDFTYVDDIARGTMLAAGLNGYEIINLGGGKSPYTLNDVIHTIEKLLDKKAIIDYNPFHKADLKETQADITKAGQLLGWKPQIEITDGLKRSVEWYLANKAWIADIHCED